MTPAGPTVTSDPRSTQLPPNFGTALGIPRPRPFDPTEENQLGLNSRNLQQDEAYLDEQRDQTIRDYGLDDPTDPFSRARALQLAYQNRDRGNLNSYAARGQLYSGALQNANNDSALGYAQGYDSLRKGQNDVLAQLERKRALAKSGKEQADINANSAAVDRAVNTPVDPLTVPPPQPKPGQQGKQPLPLGTKKKRRFFRDPRDTGKPPADRP